MTAITHCRCVRLTLKDGTELGMTDLDRDLEIAGLVYKASRAFQPEAVAQNINLAPHSLKIHSIVDAEGITVADIIAGRLNEAKVVYAKVDYRHLPDTLLDGIEILLSGVVGEITTTDSRYTLEIRSLSASLNQGVSLKASPACRWQFGSTEPGECFSDGSTTRDLASLTFTGAVTSSGNRKSFNLSFSPTISLKYGLVEITSGKNKGLIATINRHQAGTDNIELLNSLPFPLISGDTVIVQAGCAKTVEACKAYGNFYNFGNFPPPHNKDSAYMPGTDKIIAAPTR